MSLCRVVFTCDSGACHSSIALTFLRRADGAVAQDVRIHGARAFRRWYTCAICGNTDVCDTCVAAGRLAALRCWHCRSSNWRRARALTHAIAYVTEEAENNSDGGSVFGDN